MRVGANQKAVREKAGAERAANERGEKRSDVADRPIRIQVAGGRGTDPQP